MQRTTIIVAGGKGTRMGADLPKQFISIHELPILGHTLRQFAAFDANMELIVVLPEDWVNYWEIERTKYQLPEHLLVVGGAERFHSVSNGLAATSATSTLIAVHDAVRPGVNLATIERCFDVAQQEGAAIPVMPLVDSLRKVTGKRSVAVDRSVYRSVQTPQVFQAELLKECYNQGYNVSFTDDASVVEMAGYTVHLVEGNTANLKATNPEDLELLKYLLDA